MRTKELKLLHWQLWLSLLLGILLCPSNSDLTENLDDDGIGFPVHEANTSVRRQMDSIKIMPTQRSNLSVTKTSTVSKIVNKNPTVLLPSDPEISTDGIGFERHPCRRVCQGGSLTCYYKLVLHNYQRLGPECKRCPYDVQSCDAEYCIYGDGVPSVVMAVNRQVPGPAIEVCRNDTVIVDVVNYLSEPTTVHWHGIHMVQTPAMDGAPFITQYPVQPGEAYRYAFNADRSGTLWWHSDMGWQRSLGIAGAFVIRDTRLSNPHSHLYDFDLIEHTLLIQDIVYNYNFAQPTNILINGKGRNHRTSLPDNDPRHRYERIRVSQGSRYRMRVILNGIFDCPIEFSIENHQLLIVSTDGNDIEPVWADTLYMGSAERYDFILDANQYPGNYWIRVRGFNNCSTEQLYQGAVLHYRGSSRNQSPNTTLARAHFSWPNTTINYLESYAGPMEAKDNAKETINVATTALRSVDPISWPRYTKFLTYYSSFGSRVTRNGERVFQIDDLTYRQPDISLLQGRYLYREDTFFCNRSSLSEAGFNCVRDNCECTNVISLPAYKPIELVIANFMETAQPLHVHGYTLRLVGQGVIGNIADLRRIRDLDRGGRLQRVPDDFPAVEKDTIQIPARGYIITRFLSNNPGFWMYHCHIETHALQGMVAVLKVGDLREMKSTPPKLRC